MNVRLYCTEYRLLLRTKKCNTLNNIGVLLKGVLFDAKTSLRACCVHARHRARNLSNLAIKSQIT